MLIFVPSNFPYVQHYHPVPQDSVLRIVVITASQRHSDTIQGGGGGVRRHLPLFLKFFPCQYINEHCEPQLVSTQYILKLLILINK